MAGSRWPSLEVRLREKLVVMPSGCWEWQGARIKFGYGRIWLGPRGSAKGLSTHRVAYEMWVGPIPDGLSICHHCDNPPCCNPAHLFAGTRADNNRDMVEKGRLVSPDRLVECKRGHAMTEDNIYIRPDNGKRSCLTCNRRRSRYVRRPPQTHCHRGHELPPDRRCRPCGAANMRRYRKARRLATGRDRVRIPTAMAGAADRLDEAIG